MNCKDCRKKISMFLKGDLKGNELRKTYFHIEKCNECKDVLLDEFSFYTTFNDLDGDLGFNYKKKLDELLKNTKNSILTADKALTNKYILYSITICTIGIVILLVAIKFVFA